MKVRHNIWLPLLILHQFVIFPNWDNAYDLPKMLIHAVLLTSLLLFLAYKKRTSTDLIQKDPTLRFAWLLFCFIPFFSDLYHQSEWLIHSLGLGSLMYCLPYFLSRYPINFNVISRYILGLFLIVSCIDFMGFLPWYQGSEYHISGMVGNPNLLAVVILFWYFLGFPSKGKPPLRIVDFVVLVLLCITLCRTAILAFFLIHLIVLLKHCSQQKRKLVLFNGTIVILLLLYYGITNPHKINMFSSLSIRTHEALTAVDIFKQNFWLGIGQGNFPQYYFNELKNTNFNGLDPFLASESEFLNIRWSTSIHQSVLLLFLWLGGPLGLIWIISLICILYKLKRFIKTEFMASLLAIFLAAQMHFVLDFSLLLMPTQILIAHIYSLSLASDENGLSSNRRWLPFLFMIPWAVFWLLKYDLNSLRHEMKKEQDFIDIFQHPLSDGEDKHRLVQFRLRLLSAENKGYNWDDLHKLLNEAHDEKPDPSSSYNRAMIYYRQGFNSNALRELNLGISRIPTYSEYYFARSLLQDNSGDEIRDLLICFRLNRKHYSASKNLGISYAENGNLELAIFSFRNALKSLKYKAHKWTPERIVRERELISGALNKLNSALRESSGSL